MYPGVGLDMGGRGYSARGAILLEIGKCFTAQLVCADDMFFSLSL
jgi:hypothetical protein